MKRLLLLSLCLIALKSQAQSVQYINKLACAITITYYAYDPNVCNFLAVSSPVVVPANTFPPGAPIPISWFPAMPGVPFVPVAEVSYNCPGAPSVLIGSVCSFQPHGLIPASSCCFIPGAAADFPSGMVDPTIGLPTFPLNAQ